MNAPRVVVWPAEPTLYSFRRCPYAMRARLALAVSGAVHEHREVVLRNKPAELLAVSPKATVPVLVLRDGAVLDQSLDIMLWALQLNDPESWLAPERASLDEMLGLIAGNDGAFKKSLDRYKYPARYASEHAGDEAGYALSHRAAAAACLMKLEKMLGTNEQAWLFGTRASLADMAVLPFVRQFAHTNAAWFGSQAWQQLAGWLARFEGSVIYAGVMKKHPPWQG